MANQSDVVRTEIEGDIGLIVLNNPPVNAAGFALRAGLVQALATLAGKVRVIALYAEGRTFVAGADIREFGRPSKDPQLPEVVRALETNEIPVIAVLHGTALGGGLELALGCHARVAVPGTRLGLPEIHLGLFPGAGGTQRTPRLTGIAAALDLILSGRPVPAEKALSIGLIDKVIDAAPRDAALIAAQAALAGGLALRATGSLDVPADDAALERARAGLARQPQLVAPAKAVEAVTAAQGDFTAGLALERQLFTDCMEHPQSAAMIHAFFADRTVAKVPERNAQPRDIARCGVIGGGTMGAGIATAMLLAGLPVTLIERDNEAANRARATISDNLDGAVRRGKMTPQARQSASLSTAQELDALAKSDLIVEAVFEDMAVKTQIFGALDQIARPGAVLASNTSYLDINQIAAATSRPEDVLGLHFFSPAHVMKLAEVVVGDKTAPETTATGFALARKLGKIAVRAGVCDGFIGNRILGAYSAAVNGLVLDGATPQQVDNALEKWGFAMGPFAVLDMAGLDIGWANRKRLAALPGDRPRALTLPDRLCEAGRFGRKTGRGVYLYDGKTRQPDPEVLAWLDEERAAKGLTPRSFTDEDIQDRALTAIIAEGARVLADGIAMAPVDIDAVYLNGYGFPRFRGGPMFHGDRIGATELARRLQDWSEADPVLWRLPDLISDMARTGRSFADMNKERI